MATDKPRFSVTFTDESFDKIQKYQRENNISTQSKAVARLVELAINEIELAQNTKKSPGADEAAPGESTSHRLLAALGLTKEGEKLSDEDLSFLEHIISLLDAWFRKSH